MDSLSLLRSQYLDDEDEDVVQQVDDLNQQEAIIAEMADNYVEFNHGIGIQHDAQIPVVPVLATVADQSLEKEVPSEIQQEEVVPVVPVLATVADQSLEKEVPSEIQQEEVVPVVPVAIVADQTLEKEVPSEIQQELVPLVSTTTSTPVPAQALYSHGDTVDHPATVAVIPNQAVIAEEEFLEPNTVVAPVDLCNGMLFPGKLHTFISSEQEFVRFAPSGGGFFFVSPAKFAEFKLEFKKPMAQRKIPQYLPEKFLNFTKSLDYHDFEPQAPESSAGGAQEVGPVYMCLTDPLFGPESTFKRRGKKTKGKKKA